MNQRQVNAILALRSEYPEPMVVGWRSTTSGAVLGQIFESVEHDEIGQACGEFSICTTGVVRWRLKPS